MFHSVVYDFKGKDNKFYTFYQVVLGLQHYVNKKYILLKIRKFYEIVFADSVKRHIFHVKNSPLGHDLLHQ